MRVGEQAARGSAVRVQAVAGAAVRPWIEALADLRIEVFAEWPYRYAGDRAYEARYLAAYAEAPEALFVLALAEDEAGGERVVGVATGVPLGAAEAAVRVPFEAAGLDPATVFYFGESVLRASHRGHGLGHAFFDAREAHARALRAAGAPLTHTAFCAVRRDPALAPPGARDLKPFWRARGYVPRPDLTCVLHWREAPGAPELPHELDFWLRAL